MNLHHRIWLTLLVSIFGVGVWDVSIVRADAIRPGFNANTLPGTDDGSVGPVNLGFTANFFGNLHTSTYVNNNGNITFGGPLGTFTPFDLTSTGQQIIAPFFADVDTRSGNPTQYGTGTVNGRNAFGVTWSLVDYYTTGNSPQLNSFQLVLIDRADTGAGNFDIEFNYDQIRWETGDASFGVNGLGGSSARVGFSNGSGLPNTFFELPGSAIPGSFLDSNVTTGLIYQTNVGVPGRMVFQARNGSVQQAEVPEPATLLLWGIGAMATAVATRRRQRARG